MSVIKHLLTLSAKYWQQHALPKWRGCRRITIGCLGLLILFLIVGCGLLFWSIIQVKAAPPPPTAPLAVFLLIDNSQSMYDLGGTGADPELLRIDAARLFLSYLGVDETDANHASGVIFFGTEANITVPLTSLTNDTQRQAVFDAIQNPQPMGWTDQAEALSLAITNLKTDAVERQPVIVLLTDGKPQWADAPTPEEQSAYAARLRWLGMELAQDRIPLFIILLANEATDADPEITTRWRPIWQEMAAATTPGQFYEARHAADLTGIYHDIVVSLSGGRTKGVVLQQAVTGEGIQQTVIVQPQLARMTLVISKSQSNIKTAVFLPDGTPLSTDMPGVRHAGGELEAVWVIPSPPPGVWTIQMSGQGTVTVWQDYLPAPTPMPTNTPSPLGSTTGSTTGTPQATAAETPQPTAVATQIAAHPVTAVPTMTPLSAAAAPLPDTPKQPWWLFILLVTAAVTGFGGVRYRQQRRPVVTGTLRHLSGPGFADGQTEYLLDTPKRSSVVIGAAGVHIPLIQAESDCKIEAGAAIGDTFDVLIAAEKGVLLNNRPVLGTQPLHDADIITIGSTRLRYENLRLRHARQTIQIPISRLFD